MPKANHTFAYTQGTNTFRAHTRHTPTHRAHTLSAHTLSAHTDKAHTHTGLILWTDYAEMLFAATF